MFLHERYTATVEGAAVFEQNARGRIVLTGSDRLAYLQGLLTNDVAALSTGTGCYAALLTPQGRMISDMRVFELGDSVLLDVPAEVAPRVASHLSDFIFSEDAAVQDASGSLSHFVLLGAASAMLLSLDRLAPFQNRKGRVGAVEAVLAGNDEFGVRATDIFVDTTLAPSIRAALSDAAVVPIDEEVAEALRIEAGRPRFGVDMHQDTIPLEAGIEDRAISQTKGCYVGQEVIIRVLHRGQGRVARRLVGLMFPRDRPVPQAGERLHVVDREIGSITSATWSPALERPIALGYVHRDFTAPGTQLQAGTEPQPATVTTMPFVVRS